jgi:hypothetical protein
VLDFVTRGETADQIGTFNRRTEIWTLAWDSFMVRPLHGLGFTSAKGVFFDQTGLGGAHNALVNVMIDVGLVGLCWWLAMIGFTIAALRALRPFERRTPAVPGASGSLRSDRLILIGIVAASLVNSVTTEGLGAGVNVSAIWWFLAIAWLATLDRTVRSAGPPEPIEHDAARTQPVEARRAAGRGRRQPVDPTSAAKYGIVSSRPSRRPILGCHPRRSRAAPMSGRRWRGSSLGNGRSVNPAVDPVSSITRLANSSIVNSSGLPMLIGPTSSLSSSARNPRISSAT